MVSVSVHGSSISEKYHVNLHYLNQNISLDIWPILREYVLVICHIQQFIHIRSWALYDQGGFHHVEFSIASWVLNDVKVVDHNSDPYVIHNNRTSSFKPDCFILSYYLSK